VRGTGAKGGRIARPAAHVAPPTEPGMKTHALARAAALLLACACAAPEPAPHAALPLLDADRAFAHDAQERGLAPAFLEVLGDGAVVFRPGPVSARTWFEQHPDQAEVVEWWPDTAEIAGCGDFGWTAGTWELREADEDDHPGPTLARGRYVTVWRLERGGVWRVVLDHGAALPEPASGERPVTLRELATGAPVAPRGPTATFAAADMALARAIDAGGGPLREWLDEGVELQREGQVLSGAGAADEAWAPWRPLHGSTGAGVLVSGDGRLGATCGTLEGAAGGAAWLRLWRIELEGALPMLALELLTPLPAR
jgi:ketosteroid isomerase-like protein